MLGKRKHAQQETCDKQAEIGVRDAGEAELEAKCEWDGERDWNKLKARFRLKDKIIAQCVRHFEWVSTHCCRCVAVKNAVSVQTVVLVLGKQSLHSIRSAPLPQTLLLLTREASISGRRLRPRCKHIGRVSDVCDSRRQLGVVTCVCGWFLELRLGHGSQ